MAGTITKCGHHPWRSAGVSAVLVAACFTPDISAPGQAGPAAPAKPPVFEVATVKLSNPDCPGVSVTSLAGRFSAQCTTLLGLLTNAYPIKPNDSIPGLPGWGTTELFDVDAKADDGTAAAMEKLPREEQWKLTQAMIQALLADRFKLRVRNESRKGQIYTLSLAKGGFKLKDAPESDASSGYSWSRGHIQIHKGQVSSLTSSLSDVLGRTVVDKTGLTGKYDIDLRWAPDDQQGSADAGSALVSALEEQLGLKLESTKGQVEIFVIDHVERPAKN
jgi:uncharacterized protein (TIGR03435 family)